MTNERPSQKYSLLIGGITAYWSVTELICDHALALLLRIDPNLSRSITATLANFEARLNVLKAVSERTIEQEELLEEFRGILERISSASRERNRVVHSVWFNLGYEDMVPTKYSFESGKAPIVESVKYTPEKLRQVLNQIKDATEDLTTFLLERLGMPPSMPGVVINVSGENPPERAVSHDQPPNR